MSLSCKSLLAVYGLLFLVACAEPVYVANNIDAQVVDAETGEPIKGANVIAHWQLEQAMFDGYRMAGQLKVMETVTDHEGRFHFDGFTSFNWPNKELRNLDPQVIIFKSGYEYKKIFNYYMRPGTVPPGKTRTAAVDGKIVKLQKMDLSNKALQSGDITVYSGLRHDLSPLTYFAKDCEWEGISNFILAMDAEKERILKLYPSADVDLVVIANIPDDRGCSAADEIFNQ